MIVEKAKSFLRGRGQAYRKVFRGIHSELVLEDLAKFCRANDSTFDKDSRVEGIMQGRREVWLRITAHLNMTNDELWSHFNPRGE